MSRLMTKPTKWHVHPAKTQISLGIRPVWSVFVVRMKKLGSLTTYWAHGEKLWSDWADAQADLILRWTHSHFVDFVMRHRQRIDATRYGFWVMSSLFFFIMANHSELSAHNNQYRYNGPIFSLMGKIPCIYRENGHFQPNIQTGFWSYFSTIIRYIICSISIALKSVKSWKK